MNLYHGTYEENLLEIINTGYLDNTKCLGDTLEVDRILENYLGKKLTNDAVYLTDDIICTQMAYDFEFKINTNELDTKYLYVAEYCFRDEIMAYSDDCEEGIEAIKNYIESFVSFGEYINNKLKYENPEFLYFNKIDISKSKDEVMRYLEEQKTFI